jgi:hypothetical protein
MTRNRLARRFVPALFLAVFVTACGGSTNAPAVDAKQLQQRLDQFVASLTKPQADADFTAKAEGGAKVETKDDGTVIGTLPRLSFSGKEAPPPSSTRCRFALAAPAKAGSISTRRCPAR